MAKTWTAQEITELLWQVATEVNSENPHDGRSAPGKAWSNAAWEVVRRARHRVESSGDAPTTSPDMAEHTPADSLDCVFCEIVYEGAPAEIVHETDNSLIIVPLNPVTPGHLIAIPRTHLADAAAYPELTGIVASDVAYWARQQRREGTLGDFNLITSTGVAATQTVRHLHWHLVPRHTGDGLHLPWTGQAARAAEIEREAR